MDAPAGPRQERVWFAHAIRGPACLLVVLTHLFHLFPNEQAPVARLAHFEPAGDLPRVPWAGALAFLDRQKISPGTVGVLLFLLVSGFVIPFSLQRSRPRRSSCAASSGCTPRCGSASSSPWPC